MQRPIRCGLTQTSRVVGWGGWGWEVGGWGGEIVVRRLVEKRRDSAKLFSPLAQPLFINPFHTARSHYARSCQWVSLYAVHLFDNKQEWRWGGKIKALTAFILERFSCSLAAASGGGGCLK